MIPVDALNRISERKTYSEVTLSGCKQLCLKLHDETCSRIFFFPENRFCILTPDVGITVTENDNKSVEAASVFERHRCPGNCSINAYGFLSSIHPDYYIAVILKFR